MAASGSPAPGMPVTGMPPPTPEQLAMEQAALAIPGMTREKMMYQLMRASDDRSGEILGTAIAMAIITTVVVALRFYCRKKMKVGISWDDWTMLACQVLMIGLSFNLAWGRLSRMKRAFPSASADDALYRCNLCDWTALADHRSGNIAEMAKGELKSSRAAQV
ncbi:MAG: hypothetical protein Q9174_001648 [Haloplaca sp. 1 TL-2023]